MDEFKVCSSPHREVVRIKPDGTWSIEPDITIDKMHTVFHTIVETAANLLKLVNQCEQEHKGRKGPMRDPLH